MKYIIILAFMGIVACTATPSELPVDFDPEFRF
ncbi:MAG: hypothetical protein ACJAXK_001029 [Yoonia sp.]|jgi:hypothetical protein